jgi:hypothetical protein
MMKILAPFCVMWGMQKELRKRDGLGESERPAIEIDGRLN